MNDRPDAPTAPVAAPAAPQAIPAKAEATAVAQAHDDAKKDEGGVKDTIEQILVAFILAFIFRAFVVEAFVIPTGSMAPTLLGAHMRFVCEDCGYQFDTNYSATSTPGSPDDLNIPQRNDRAGIVAVCPNCAYRIPYTEPGQQAFRPLVRYGDRILVLKYLYLFEDPKRWDVVVFKSPDAPRIYDYTQNYIKRLIGKPNEAIMILDGDIYVGAHDARPEEMTIQTKPRDVQESLWRVIYDNDYYPQGVAREGAPWQQPWTRRPGQQGWDIGTSTTGGRAARTFHFNNSGGGAEIFFNDQANIGPRISLFSDWLAYDVEDRMRTAANFRLVGDLRLKLSYVRESGDGPLRLILSKRGVTFVAEIGPETARLLRADRDGTVRELAGPTALPAGAGGSASKPLELEFFNADYQVVLRANGRELFSTTPEQYQPDVAALISEYPAADHASPPAVRVQAERQVSSIAHVSLWRDIYYINYLSYQSRFDATQGKNTPFSGAPDNVMRLGPDEYFVLGDNSQISGDGRYWADPTVLPDEDLDVPAGRVPGRFMLGKAFFVYWPAGYRPFESAPVPLVPNFGDMRFIK